jgi:hypothetical protein
VRDGASETKVGRARGAGRVGWAQSKSEMLPTKPLCYLLELIGAARARRSRGLTLCY